ncbi:MAG: hypothetical protein U5K81_05250 [Trueperaceae bacterium]|nr:hypothetical protein [Trueperaceae bacterium]
MRRPSHLRLAALLGASASVAVAALVAWGVHLLSGARGRLGFDAVNAQGLLEGLVFVVVFVTALRYVRSAVRLPSPTLLSFGVVAPPTAARVAHDVPQVDAAQGLHTLIDNRIVIVEENGVPVGVAGVRRERITSWEDLVKVDGHVAVTDLRRVLAHEPLVIVMEGGEVVGVVTQEMYLAGLWGAVR